MYIYIYTHEYSKNINWWPPDFCPSTICDMSFYRVANWPLWSYLAILVSSKVTTHKLWNDVKNYNDLAHFETAWGH